MPYMSDEELQGLIDLNKKNKQDINRIRELVTEVQEQHLVTLLKWSAAVNDIKQALLPFAKIYHNLPYSDKQADIQEALAVLGLDLNDLETASKALDINGPIGLT